LLQSHVESTERATLTYLVSNQTRKEQTMLLQCGNLPGADFKLHNKQIASVRQIF